jgi:uncharacterized membrane protein (UPF0182 family)
MLVPFFWQSAHVTPIATRDSLYWAVHLYSASDYYPLSEHTRLGGDDISFVRHAATAIVHAHSGHVTIVADSVLDPIASTWVRRFPALFASWSAVPTTVIANIPPPIETAVVQAAAFSRCCIVNLSGIGLRPASSPAAHLPTTFGADTLFSGAWRPPHLVATNNRLAWTTPLLDAGDRVNGLIVSVGGAQPVTYWYPLTDPAVRWPAVLERLQRAPDSPPPPRDVTLRRGSVHVVPIRDGSAAYAQTTYGWRADAAPTIARVAIHGAGTTRDSVAFGASLAEAAGVRVEPVDLDNELLTPAVFRRRADELYGAMREAMRRGDWVAFGKAYDDLGRLLRTPSPK